LWRRQRFCELLGLEQCAGHHPGGFSGLGGGCPWASADPVRAAEVCAASAVFVGFDAGDPASAKGAIFAADWAAIIEEGNVGDGLGAAIE